jgi:DNA (cytosine-5)-methyltransferase 1
MDAHSVSFHRDFLVRNSEFLLEILDKGKRSDSAVPSDARKELCDSISREHGIDEEAVKQLCGLGFIRDGDWPSDSGITSSIPVGELIPKITIEPLRKRTSAYCIKMLGRLGCGEESAVRIINAAGRIYIPGNPEVGRVVQRLIGADDEQDGQRNRLELLPCLPEGLRIKAYWLLLSHAKSTCLPEPLCDKCSIGKFCGHWRSSKNRHGDANAHTVIDLFSGCGGASLGLKKAGFRSLMAADINNTAIDTFYLNFPEADYRTVACTDLTMNLENRPTGDVDLVFAGPPCQGWSRIGKTRKNGNNGKSFFKDEKNRLFFDFIRELKAISPKVFVMENVPGLLTAHGGEYVSKIEKEMRRAGYGVRRVLINTKDYGIPQNRERILFIGVRKDLGPDPEGAAGFIIQGIEGRKIPKPVSFRAAVRGLPRLDHGQGSDVIRIAGMNIQGRKRAGKGRADLVYNHRAREHNPIDLEIYAMLKEGDDYSDIEAQKPDSRLLPYSNDSFHTKYRKIKGKEPCYTIISHLVKDSNSYVHPTEVRGITVREAARVQTFPDDFVFLGNGYRNFILVGNAFPPRMGEIIGKSISGLLDQIKGGEEAWSTKSRKQKKEN